MNQPKNLRPETKHCVCRKCGKEWHYADAKYCGGCGEKLKEAQRRAPFNSTTHYGQSITHTISQEV